MIRVPSSASMAMSASQSQSQQSHSMDQSSPPSSRDSSIFHKAGSSPKDLHHAVDERQPALTRRLPSQLVAGPRKRVRNDTMRAASGSGSISLSSRVPSGRGGSAVMNAPSNYLVTVLPPPTLPDEHHRAHGAYGGPPSKFRRGTLIPLYPTLSSQCAAIAREYGLPSAGGIVLYLVEMASHHDNSRHGNTSSTMAMSPQSRSGEDGLAASLIGGPKISEQAWHILWNRLFLYQHELQIHESHLNTSSGSNGELDDSDDSGSDDLRFQGRPPSSPTSSYIKSPQIRKAINRSRADSRVPSPSETRSTASSSGRQTSTQYARYNPGRTVLQGSTNARPNDDARTASIADLPSPQVSSLGDSRKSATTKTEHTARDRSVGGDNFSQLSMPPYGQTVVVGKLEFDIDQRRGAKWYDAWLAGAHAAPVVDDASSHSRDTPRRRRVVSHSTTGQSLLGTGRLHFERSILNEPETSQDAVNHTTAKQSSPRQSPRNVLPASLLHDLASSPRLGPASSQDDLHSVQFPSAAIASTTPSKPSRDISNMHTPISGDKASRLSPTESRPKRPSLTARSASSASVASMIHGFEFQQNDSQRKSPAGTSSRSGSVTSLAKEFEAKQQAQSPLSGVSPIASPLVSRTRKTSTSAISPLRRQATATTSRSDRSEASGYSDNEPSPGTEAQYAQLTDHEDASHAQDADHTMPDAHRSSSIASSSSKGLQAASHTITSATSNDPLQDMFMSDERNWAMMRAADSDNDEVHASDMATSHDVERIESAQSVSFPADTLSTSSKLPASASSTFDPFEFEEELTAASATGDDIEEVKEMLHATSHAKSNGLSSPIILNEFGRNQFAEDEHSSDSDAAPASPRHDSQRSSTTKSSMGKETMLVDRNSQRLTQTASGVTISEPVDNDDRSESMPANPFARDPKIVARLQTEDVARNRSSSIEMMNSLDEIERALQELSPRSNRRLNASPMAFGSFAETAQSLHYDRYDRLPVVAQIQGYQRDSSDEGTAPLTPPYAHRNVSELSLYATADEDARGSNGQSTSASASPPNTTVSLGPLPRQRQGSPRIVTGSHSANGTPVRAVSGSGSSPEATATQTRLVGLKIRGWPGRSSKDGKEASASASNASSSPRSPRGRDVDPQGKGRLQDTVQSSLQSGIQKFKLWAGSSGSNATQPVQDLAQSTALPESPVMLSGDRPPRLPRKSSLHNAMTMVKPLPRSDSLSPNMNGQQTFSQLNTPNLNSRLFGDSNVPSPPTHTRLPSPPVQRSAESNSGSAISVMQHEFRPIDAERGDAATSHAGTTSPVPSWMALPSPLDSQSDEQPPMIHQASPPNKGHSLRAGANPYDNNTGPLPAPSASPSFAHSNAHASDGSNRALSPSPSPSRLANNKALPSPSPSKAVKASPSRDEFRASKDMDLARLMSQMRDLDFADEQLS